MRTRRRAAGARSVQPKRRHGLPHLGCADRKALLLGTALASTLLLGSLAAPTPTSAQVTCPPGTFPPPNPIAIILPGNSIDCVNVFDRNDTIVINLQTNGGGEFIDLANSGDLTATNAAGITFGIRTFTSGASSPIEIMNSGAIRATGLVAYGIYAQPIGPNSPISIVNSGDIFVVNTGYNTSASGVYAVTSDIGGPIAISNSGNISVVTYSVGLSAEAHGIYAKSLDPSSPLIVSNSGNIAVTGVGDSFVYGVLARTGGPSPNSPVSITNSGDIIAASNGYGADAHSIFAVTAGDDSPIEIINSGRLTATTRGNVAHAYGISVDGFGPNSLVTIINTGDVGADTSGIFARAVGIHADTFDLGNSIAISNSGDITVTTDRRNASAIGIDTFSQDPDSPIRILNHGDIRADTDGTDAPAIGIDALTADSNSPIGIENGGNIRVSAAEFAAGINALTFGPNSPVRIVNSGDIAATHDAGRAALGIVLGIFVQTDEVGSPTLIENSGSVRGGSIGISASGLSGTTIINSGFISADSLLAIQSFDTLSTEVFNTGTILGFIEFDADDRFINQAGGVFEARQTSDFGDGMGIGDDDLFGNWTGGTVHTADNPARRETTAFVNLERFENRGLISLQDGAPGDTFQISNTVDGTDLNFAASGNSTLAVDAFLGGPGSPSDTFTIEGNVSGTTQVQVNNTNAGPGVFNLQGIPVVFVTGNTPNPNAFFLRHPIDTGFFNYDLFFQPTGSGLWEFRSFPGGGAHLLPQLTTAAQDIWHAGSSTWFDRTADLRVLLAGGAAPIAYDPGANYADGLPPGAGLTPAVWARGSGTWLDRDDSATTRAFSRTYTFDLSRDLEIMDFQMGFDLGHRDLLSPGDILVFGVLGGFVEASLDYDQIVREFDFDGGQVGAYATYLKGGLFVDTLLNAHLYELDANGALGFPSSDLNANTIGLRTDTGYRFGSFSGGAFLEPLATIEVLWADIDGFSFGGNTVSFDDDANVRGRLGLRAGTTMQAWEGTIMEPFVIGSVWGNFTDDNQARLVSSGTTFRFEDHLDDVWGEVSAGVNFFNPSATTAVFAKVDVTFGDDVSGGGGKAGMRVSW